MPGFEKKLLNNRYQIIADINKGSYGVVSLAKDVGGDGSLVAIKCITKSSNNPVYEEALYEVEMHKRLGNHNNVVQLIDFFDEDGKAYLVLEYCGPGDLYEAIKAGRGPREQNCVLDFMLQLIDSVEYCHSKGVYHRDIKPENILIGNDGSVKLADWGLATTIKINNEFGIGSERYMAPELFDQANTKEYDAEKADIWAIGICLLNILFGRNPFTVASQKDKLFLDFATSREALFDIFPSLSEDVFAALRHSLTMDPDNRNLSKLRKELLAVRMWTTDDYYDEEEEYEENYNDNDEINEYEKTKNYDYEEEEEDTISVDMTPVVAAATATPVPVTVPIDSSIPTIPTTTHSDSLKVPDTFITTTTNRQPFRTPTGVKNLTTTMKYDIDWNRTMQFTPPTKGHSFFPNSKVKTPSNLSFVLSVGANGLPLQTVGEEEDNDDRLLDSESSGRRRRGSDGSTSNGSIIDDGHEDVFAMDGELSGTFNKLSLNNNRPHHSTERNSSGSDSSISSVPSLVQSTVLEEPALPRQRFTFNGASSSFTPSNGIIPKLVIQGASPSRDIATGVKNSTFLASSAPPSHDFLKLGKSWSDIDFDEEEDEYVEDDFYYKQLRNAVPSGTGAVSTEVSTSKQPSVTIKAIPGNKTRSPTIAGKSHPNPGQSWVYPHWVN